MRKREYVDLGRPDGAKDLRNRLSAVADRLNVIGHSMGGFVVQKYLQSYDAPAGVLMASTPLGATTSLDAKLDEIISRSDRQAVPDNVVERRI